MRRRVAHKIKVPMTKVKVTVEGLRFVTYKSCIHKISKTTEVNLIKFHTMVRHYKKVCLAQNSGSYDQGQGHSHKL